MVRVRFAPSPTGFLHLGNTRTALLNALFALKHKGFLLLRMDDTDLERCKKEYSHAIEKDLLWLGVHWQEQIFQSQRQEVYQKAIDFLKNSGRLYPCFETPEELKAKREAQLAKGKPPIYDRASLHHPAPKDRAPHWRFLLQAQNVTWSDGIQGDMSYHLRHLSDPVVIREDGSLGYILSSVIDDLDTRITHIIRGADHLTNTAIQIQMFQALGETLPVFAHFPLMMDSKGEKFSKRTGSLTVGELRKEGVLPEAIAQSLVFFGTSQQYEAHQRKELTLENMAQNFDLTAYSGANSQFDLDCVFKKSAEIFQHMAFQEITDYALREGLEPPISSAFWDLISPNIQHPKEIDTWNQVLTKKGALTNASFSKDFLDQLIGCAPKEPWGKESWNEWIGLILKEMPDMSKKSLCLDLRVLLTGQKYGPQMKELMPFLTLELVKNRLTFDPTFSR